jgi:hypothetical protein
MDKSKEIDLDRLTEIFDVDQPVEFWFADDCDIDDEGIRPKPVNQKAMDLLCGDEWREIRRFRRDICLTLPCSRKDVEDWAKRNGFEDRLPEDFSDILPDDFLETTKEKVVVDNQSIEQLNEIDQVKKQGDNNKERDLTKWFRETWVKEGQPNGSTFFNALKKYVNQQGSPIREHYTTGQRGAGIRWNTGSTSNSMTKKNIQTMVSKFKNEIKQKSVNS